MKKLILALSLFITSTLHSADTKNVVPRADAEGSLGTLSKNWSSIFVTSGTIRDRVNLSTVTALGSFEMNGYALNNSSALTIVAPAGFTDQILSISTGSKLVFLVTGSTSIFNNKTIFNDSVSVGISSTNVPLHISKDGVFVSTKLYTFDLIVVSQQNAAPGINIVAAQNAATGRGVFKATKARGTLDNPSPVAEDDMTFSLIGSGYDGSTNQASGVLSMIVDGPVSAGVVPQRISFITSEDSGVNRTEKMVVKSKGFVGIGITTPSAYLHVYSTGQSQPLFYVSTSAVGKQLEINRSSAELCVPLYLTSATATGTFDIGDANATRRLIHITGGSGGNYLMEFRRTAGSAFHYGLGLSILGPLFQDIVTNQAILNFGLNGSTKTVNIGSDSTGAYTGRNGVLKAENAGTGSTDLSGATLTIRSGAGRGNSEPSSILLETPDDGVSGTAAQTYSTKLKITGNGGRIEITSTTLSIAGNLYHFPSTAPATGSALLYDAGGKVLWGARGGTGGGTAVDTLLASTYSYTSVSTLSVSFAESTNLMIVAVTSAVLPNTSGQFPRLSFRFNGNNNLVYNDQNYGISNSSLTIEYSGSPGYRGTPYFSKTVNIFCKNNNSQSNKDIFVQAVISSAPTADTSQTLITGIYRDTNKITSVEMFVSWATAGGRLGGNTDQPSYIEVYRLGGLSTATNNGVDIYDEELMTVRRAEGINFKGAGVSVAQNGSTATVTITGGGGGDQSSFAGSIATGTINFNNNDLINGATIYSHTVRLSSGANGSPSFSFFGSSITGMYYNPSSNIIVFTKSIGGARGYPADIMSIQSGGLTLNDLTSLGISGLSNPKITISGTGSIGNPHLQIGNLGRIHSDASYALVFGHGASSTALSDTSAWVFKTSVTVQGTITTTNSITASTYYGDGSNLSGITGGSQSSFAGSVATSAVEMGGFAVNNSSSVSTGLLFVSTIVVRSSMTIGDLNQTAPSLILKGGVSGNDLLRMRRVAAGVNFEYGWGLAGGCLAFNDVVDGYVVTNICGDNADQTELYIGQRSRTIAQTRSALLSGETYGSAAGSDVPGNNLTLRAGLGTGIGRPGNIAIQTGDLQASGSTAQTASTKVVVTAVEGNVGINVGSPEYKLHLIGDAYISSTTIFKPMNSVSPTMIVTSNSFVGVGITTPSAFLHVYSTGQSQPLFYISTSAAGKQIEVNRSSVEVCVPLYFSSATGTGSLDLGDPNSNRRLIHLTGANGGNYLIEYRRTSGSTFHYGMTLSVVGPMFTDVINNRNVLNFGLNGSTSQIVLGSDAAGSFTGRNSVIKAENAGTTSTDLSGATLTIRSGAGRGDAASSMILLETPDPGASGSTIQTFSTKLTVDGTGVFGKFKKRVTTVADANSISPNADTTDIVHQVNTQAAGTLTINNPSGTPNDGQSLLIRVKCSNVQTLSFGANFRGGTIALPTATTGSSKYDYYSFIWNSIDSKWDSTGKAEGF